MSENHEKYLNFIDEEDEDALTNFHLFSSAQISVLQSQSTNSQLDSQQPATKIKICSYNFFKFCHNLCNYNCRSGAPRVNDWDEADQRREEQRGDQTRRAERVQSGGETRRAEHREEQRRKMSREKSRR